MSDALPAVEPFEQATRTTKNCLDCEACAYCGRPLHVSHEHDHFPLPARHGGMHVIPACRDCHSLKDRIAFNDWSQTAFTALLTALVSDAASPELRVFVAQAVNAMMDASQRAKDAEAQALVCEAAASSARHRAEARQAEVDRSRPEVRRCRMIGLGWVRMLLDRAATVLLARVERRLLELEAVAVEAYEVALDARALAREHDVSGDHA